MCFLFELLQNRNIFTILGLFYEYAPSENRGDLEMREVWKSTVKLKRIKPKLK